MHQPNNFNAHEIIWKCIGMITNKGLCRQRHTKSAMLFIKCLILVFPFCPRNRMMIKWFSTMHLVQIACMDLNVVRDALLNWLFFASLYAHWIFCCVGLYTLRGELVVSRFLVSYSHHFLYCRCLHLFWIIKMRSWLKNWIINFSRSTPQTRPKNKPKRREENKHCE